MDGKYIVFLDIDGTLMGADSAALKKNMAAVQRVRSLGHKVLINTGRATANLPRNIDCIRDFDGLSAGAGAIVTLDGKEIFRKLMPYTLNESFCRLSVKTKAVSLLEGEKNMYVFSQGQSDDFQAEWIRLDEKNYKKVITPELPIEKFTVRGTLSDCMRETFKEECLLIQNCGYAEILHKESGKGKALLRTAEYLEVPIERTVAIGDSMNDFDMIRAAGIGVAMGNAVDEIKNEADFVTDGVDKAGVAAALCKIFSLE